jgi:hypothetical protein
MGSFIICTLHQMFLYYYDDQIKKGDISRACSMDGDDEKFIRSFDRII